MAARVKVIDLAKELGVTSKDLVVTLEAMGQKGMRVLSSLQGGTHLIVNTRGARRSGGEHRPAVSGPPSLHSPGQPGYKTRTWGTRSLADFEVSTTGRF